MRLSSRMTFCLLDQVENSARTNSKRCVLAMLVHLQGTNKNVCNARGRCMTISGCVHAFRIFNLSCDLHISPATARPRRIAWKKHKGRRRKGGIASRRINRSAWPANRPFWAFRGRQAHGTAVSSARGEQEVVNFRRVRALLLQS